MFDSSHAKGGIHFCELESLGIVSAGRIIIVLRDGDDAANGYHPLISTVRTFRYRRGLGISIEGLTNNLESDAALAAPMGYHH
jgi:hypothetical protein